MESLYTELALYGSKNEAARTDTVFIHISEVCDGRDSLIGHLTSGIGAKQHLNGTSKVNKRTHRQTHTRTNQITESIGPEGRCFENYDQVSICLGYT